MAPRESNALYTSPQIVVPRSPTRPRIKHPQGTNIEGSRSLSTGTDETESHLSHDIFGSSQVASQGVLTGVTHLTVDELCDKIRATAALSNIPIGDLFRREMPTGFQHEFILIRSAPVVGPSIWIRIDRAAKGYQRGQLRTKYPADDTVGIVTAHFRRQAGSDMNFVGTNGRRGKSQTDGWKKSSASSCGIPTRPQRAELPHSCGSGHHHAQ